MEDRVFQGMEYIYAVYKSGSFQKAAENLFISQPSISASVKRIEDRLGCQIFNRSVKPLQLTECGEKYIAAVEKIMAMEREFEEFVNDLGELRRGSLVLGGSTMFSSLVLPRLISKFSRIYPNIHLELVEETTSNLEAMLEKGVIDMVVDYKIPHIDNYDWTPLEEEHLLLAVPKAMPINNNLKTYRIDPKKIRSGEQSLDSVPAVPLGRFREEPFILLKSENDSRQRAEQLCAEAGFHPKAFLEFDQQMTSYLVSCSGMGACFASSTLVRRFGPNPDMYYYRLDGEKSQRQICIYWKRGRYFTKAMKEFRLLAYDTVPMF